MHNVCLLFGLCPRTMTVDLLELMNYLSCYMHTVAEINFVYLLEAHEHVSCTILEEVIEEMF